MAEDEASGQQTPLVLPGVTRGEFLYRTCSRARQPHTFSPGNVCCAVVLRHFDVPVTTDLTLPQQDGLQNSSVGDSPRRRPGLALRRPC